MSSYTSIIETVKYTNDISKIDSLMESGDPLNEDAGSALGELLYALYKNGYLTQTDMWVIMFGSLTIPFWPFIYNLGHDHGKWIRGMYGKFKQWMVDRKEKKTISKDEVQKMVDEIESLFDKIRSPEFKEFMKEMTTKYKDAIVSDPGNKTIILQMKRDAEKFKEMVEKNATLKSDMKKYGFKNKK